MEEFTDFKNIDLEELAGVTLESFCDRYLEEGMRVVNTGIIFPSDIEMLRLAISIVVGLYYKRVAEGIESGDKVTH